MNESVHGALAVKRIITITNSRSNDPYLWAFWEDDKELGMIVFNGDYTAYLDPQLFHRDNSLQAAVEGLFKKLKQDVDVRYDDAVTSTGIAGDPLLFPG